MKELRRRYIQDEGGALVRNIKENAWEFDEFILTDVTKIESAKEDLLEKAIATLRGLAKTDDFWIAHRFSKEEPGSCEIFGMDPDSSVSIGWKFEIPNMRQEEPDVVRLVHGKWLSTQSWVVLCDHCGCPQDYKHNYCPGCGAKMDGERKDDGN